jgi:hypothetical protein
MPNATAAERIARELCPCGCGAPISGSAPPRSPGMGRSPEAQARWGAYFENPTRFTEQGTQQRAIERGQSIEVAPPNVLQIDIDGPESYERFSEQLEIYQSCPTLPPLGKIVERDSRTPGHKHITIELDTEYTVEQRIMLQAILGSDLKRELLSLASVYNGHANPIVFYRPQEEVNAATPTGPRDGTAARTGTDDGVTLPTGLPHNAASRLRDVVRRRRIRDFARSIPADDTAGDPFTF